MRKVFTSLLVLGLFLMLPLGVFATTKIDISSTPDSEKTNDDGTVTKTYSIYMTTDANEEVSSAKISFQGGSAVKNITCSDGGDFVIENQESTTTNKATCTFSVPNEGKASGSRFQVGTLSINVDKSAPDEDCTINYTFEGVSGAVKPNPATGASVSYLVIGAAVVLAAGVYFVTSRRTKLYKI